MPSNLEVPTKNKNDERKRKPSAKDVGLSPLSLTPTTPISPEIDKLRMSFDFNVNGNNRRIAADDLVTLCELGRGAYGLVEKVKHPHPTGDTIMAVKRITATQGSKETEMLLNELKILQQSKSPFIVDFYGAMFRQGDVMICMEIMDISLDKFYMRVARSSQLIPEDVLWTIAFSVLSGLKHLHKELQVMHRDVKPSNMLIDRNGVVKLCDFGISKILMRGSFANTVEVGCKYYMAPERIDVDTKAKYSTKSDTWSFGISMIEISIGEFPYEKTVDLFKQQKQILEGDAPSLPEDERFSPSFRSFVHRAVLKNVADRPRPIELLEDPFLKETHHSKANVSTFVNDILGPNVSE